MGIESTRVALLRMINGRSGQIGVPTAAVDSEDVAYLGLNSYEMLVDLLRDAEAKGLVRLGQVRKFRGRVKWPARLTPDGIEFLEKVAHRFTKSRTAFVAMWFSSEMDDAWSIGFEPALKDAGFLPTRMDRVHHNGKICDAILATIRESALVVADFTGDRGGVYFEAGFALALGATVVWCCRKDHLAKVHFDTRQYNHIIWETPEQLYRELRDRIGATVGRPQ
jgi:hypothetical protein